MKKKKWILVMSLIGIFSHTTTQARPAFTLKENVRQNVYDNLPNVADNFFKIYDQICSLPNQNDISQLKTGELGLKIKKELYLPEKLNKAGEPVWEIFLENNQVPFNKIEITLASSKLLPTHSLYGVFFFKVGPGPTSIVKQPVLRSSVGKNFENQDCLFTSLVQIFKKDERSDKLVFRELDAEGKVRQENFSYQSPKALSEIYGAENSMLEQIRKYQSPENAQKRIKVGIIDSGVDYNHPKIAYKIERNFVVNEEKEKLEEVLSHGDKILEDKVRNSFIKGSETIKGNKSLYDYDGLDKFGDYFSTIDTHGTSIADILVKDTEEISLLVGKFGLIQFMSIAPIIKQQISMGAKIINMSFNYPPVFTKMMLDSGIKRLIKENPDVLFVVASGNEGISTPTYPGSLEFENIINVGATLPNEKIWSESNWGASVDIGALGYHTFIIPGNVNLTRNSLGTSLSSPYVARVAARMLYVNNKLTPINIKSILCETADKKPELKDKFICPGIVNEKRAIEKAKSLL